MDENTHIITLNPFFMEKNEERLDQILGLKTNLADATEAFTKFISAGKIMAQSLSQIFHTYKSCKALDSDPNVSEISQLLDTYEKLFTIQYGCINNDILKPLEKFIESDIDKAENSHRICLNEFNRYMDLLEKHLVSGKLRGDQLAQSEKQVEEARRSAILANYKFVRSVEFVENKYKSELTGTLISFLDLINNTFKSCIEGYNVTDELRNTLKTALPENKASLLSFNTQTKRGVQTLNEMIDLEQKGVDSQKILEKEGYIWKRGEGTWAKLWHRRYATIKDQRFTYYKETKSGILEKGYVDLLLTSVKPTPDKTRPYCFTIMSSTNAWLFQATSQPEMEAWMSKIQENIHASLDQVQVTRRSTPLVSHELEQHCADCGALNPSWCCINWGTSVCIHCSGVHRSLGVNVSKVRSLTLDKLDDCYTDLLKAIGNDRANQILEENAPKKPGPNATKEERIAYITPKYSERAFVGEHPSDSCLSAVLSGDFQRLVAAVLRGGLSAEPRGFSAIHAAAALGDKRSCLLIALNSDPNKLDEGGWSALSYAAFHNHVGVARVLMTAGADPLASTAAMPYAVAISKGNRLIATLFSPFSKGIEILAEYNPPIDINSLKERESE